MKKTAVFLAILTLFLLCACGAGSEYRGTWKLSYYMADGVKLLPGLNGEVLFVLEKDGKAQRITSAQKTENGVIGIFPETEDCSWEVTEKGFKIDLSDISYDFEPYGDEGQMAGKYSETALIVIEKEK